MKSPEEGGVGQGEGLGGESWERGWARRGDFRGEGVGPKKEKGWRLPQVRRWPEQQRWPQQLGQGWEWDWLPGFKCSLR